MANDLTYLIASRICHDLISPLGAIGNGVELLELSGNGSGPEMELIKESVESAKARIKFFRVAFGSAGPDQVMTQMECNSTLADINVNGRIKFTWRVEGSVPRADVRMAFLTLICIENAMPLGGEIKVDRTQGSWVFEAIGSRFSFVTELWNSLGDPAAHTNRRAADVQFALLAQHLADAAKTAKWTETNDTFLLRY